MPAATPIGEDLTKPAIVGQLTKPSSMSAAKSGDFSLATSTTGADRSSKQLAQASPEMPQKLGGYRILSELGRGGMGSIFSVWKRSKGDRCKT